MQPGMTVSAVARLHGVSPSLLFKWRQLMSEVGRTAVRADEDVVGSSRVRELEARVRDLERLLGRKTLEVDVLEISCWNGEVVRVAFAIDTCDREIIAWHATTAVSAVKWCAI
jgi:transposase